MFVGINIYLGFNGEDAQWLFIDQL